jgi:hypothetical protein
VRDLRCTHAHACTRARNANLHKHSRTPTRTSTHNLRTHGHARTHTRTRTRTHTHTHTRARTRAHAHSHSRTRARKRTHTHAGELRTPAQSIARGTLAAVAFAAATCALVRSDATRGAAMRTRHSGALAGCRARACCVPACPACVARMLHDAICDASPRPAPDHAGGIERTRPPARNP